MSYEEHYEIPAEVKKQFSEEFYVTMWDELVKVFGDRVKGRDHDDFPLVYYFSSTCGWSDALKATCENLGLAEVWKYYDSLAWYDSDCFDGEIEIELADRFAKRTNADRIRNMSDEELAESRMLCPYYDLEEDMCSKWVREDGWRDCAACALDWLKQEVSTDGN